MRINFPFFKKTDASKQASYQQVEISLPETLRLIDIIAPSAIEIKSNVLKIGEKVTRSFFIFSYPRYLTTGWLSPIINLNATLDISYYINPADTSKILKELVKKITAVQAELAEREEKGLIRSPDLEIAWRDMEELRNRLQTAQEKMFYLGVYITVYGDNEKELKEIENMLRSILEARLIFIKPCFYQQKEGFIATSPYGMDPIMIHNPLNTEPLSTCFPFVSFDLSSNEGILYGINQHNNSLILFDRFTLENANEVVFGKSGSGKSYYVKLEVLRYMMLGADVIIIDPENEYKNLAEAVDGAFFNITLASPTHINPFDLPIPKEDERPEDVLRSNIINLVGLMRIMLGGLTPEEDAIIDRAISETYAAKDITPETDPHLWASRIPLFSDLEAVLESMEGTENILTRLRKYTTGTYGDFFNQPTNITMDKQLVVFGIRNMEEELKQIAIYIIMRYIWKTVTSTLKKRILIIDEAWWMLQTKEGGSFLFGLAKRARKYWLGVTTITQDVNDFMKSEYGQPIIANSSIQVLMKQSPATIDIVQKTFNLTEEERLRLLEASVGEGLFFAGLKHVAFRSIASYAEDQIITTSPEQITKIKMAKQELEGFE
jgi:conjugal transfer ATP-binding protein TraC